MRDEAPLKGVAQRLTTRGEADVSMVLILEEGACEVEIKLPGRYTATPQIASALRAIPGVVHVEMH